MAISTRMSAPNDWTTQFYHENFPAQTPGPLAQPRPEPSIVTDTYPESTTITTAVALGTTSASVGPSPGHLTPEGGVSKPSRRRSRASRRTPTTIMNTDTTNFRALVQQFTGGTPVAPFAPAPAQVGVLNFGFGIGIGTTSGNVNPNGGMMAPSGSFHLLQEAHQHRFHQDQLRNILGVDSRFGVNYLGGTNMEGSQAHPGPSSSSSDDVNNRNGSYNMF